jgi:hypothetical protein
MTVPMKCVAVLAVLAIAGCAGRKQHLIPDFGKSFDAAFAAQRAGTGPAEAVTGLDSQEAAIISDGYRASLAPKGQKAEEQPLLLIAPPSRERPQPLAPSVPKED